MDTAQSIELNYRINICRKLRKLATLDRVRLDMTDHRSKLNLHLLKYIEYCGYEPESFIKGYLRNLQPYMIKPFQSQQYSENIVCVLDDLYRISVYIKVNMSQFEEVIVSFHEDNKNGIAKTNSLISSTRSQFLYVPVFFDTIDARVDGTDKIVAKVLVQRGMLTLPLSLSGTRVKDFMLVNPATINAAFVEYCNDYIRDLYTSSLDLDFSKVTVFTVLQQLSFTSFGRDTISSISLLIDSLRAQNDAASRAAADFALVTFSQSLTLTESQVEQIIDILTEHYAVTADKNTDCVLTRVKDNLQLHIVKEIDVSVDSSLLENRVREELEAVGHTELLSELMNVLPDREYDTDVLHASVAAFLAIKGLQ